MYEQVGHIAIMNVKGKITRQKLIELKKKAKKLLNFKNIRTVLLKQERVKGRLRKARYKFLDGEKVFDTLHKENNCIFKLNIKDVYFSSRLANNRLWLAKKILDFVKAKKIKKQRKNKEKTKIFPKILVAFCGIGAYGIVIAKTLQKEKIPYEMKMVELNKKAVKYASENIMLNKLMVNKSSNKVKVEVLQGDVKKILPKLGKFDFIVMPRPQLAYDFFKECFVNAKKESIIFYFDFVDEKDIIKEGEKLKKKAAQIKKKIEVLETKKAGQISPHKFRVCCSFKVC